MPSLLTLDGEITIHTLEQFREQLISVLGESGELTVNCRGLTYLDTTAFQLLVALKKSIGKRPLVFQEVPAAILESAALLGLNTFLKLQG